MRDISQCADLISIWIPFGACAKFFAFRNFKFSHFFGCTIFPDRAPKNRSPHGREGEEGVLFPKSPLRLFLLAGMCQG